MTVVELHQLMDIGEFRMLLFFFFNDTATTEIYTLSLHDALPISDDGERPPVDLRRAADHARIAIEATPPHTMRARSDRKSTRLNSSHDQISYAVFCLKKKKQELRTPHITGP